MTALPRRELRSRRRFPAWSMATSPHLSLKLRDALGPEAGDQMELRFAGVDTRFASIDTQFAELRRDMEKQTNRLILWTFAFWVITLAAVLGVLRTLHT